MTIKTVNWGTGKRFGEKGPHPVYDMPGDPIFDQPLDPYEFSNPDPYPNAVIEQRDPIIRCAYCGVHDTALLTCPACGGPRRWY